MTEQSSIFQRAIENKKNLHEDFMKCCQKILSTVFSNIQTATECLTKPFQDCLKGVEEECISCIFLCFIWLWLPPVFIYALIVLGILLMFFLPMAFVVVVKSTIFALIGSWPAFLLTFRATATTIYRQIILCS